MPILSYIQRMNQIYGTEPAPVRYNTQQFLQGGRVAYRGAGLVDHGPEGVRQGYSGIKKSERLSDKIKQKNIKAWEKKTDLKWIDQNSSQKSKIAKGTITGEGKGSKTKTILPDKLQKQRIKAWEEATGKKYVDQIRSAQFKIREGQNLGLGKKASSWTHINAIRDAFVMDPNITPKELMNELYGSDFKNASLKGKKIMATEVSNDIPKFLEALERVRYVKGFKIPNDDVVLDIIDNIQTNTRGFQYGVQNIRDYKLKIRDTSLGLPEGTSTTQRSLLQKLKTGSKLALDETAGLSATFEAAPGYTSGSQLIKQKVNNLKSSIIDKRFKNVMDAMFSDDPDKLYKWKGKNVNRDELIKKYNEHANKFKTKYKINVPTIEVGKSPKEAVKNYRDFSKVEQANMQDIFKKRNFSIGMGKETKPLKVILDNFWCGTRKAEGGRIGFKAGSGCPDSVKQRNFLALTDDVANKRITGEAAEQIAKQAGKVVAKVGSKTALASILGPAGIGLDIAYEVGSIGTDVLQGKPLNEAIADNWILGTPYKKFTGKTGEKLFNERLAKMDSSTKLYGDAMSLGADIEELKSSLAFQEKDIGTARSQLKKEDIARTRAEIEKKTKEFNTLTKDGTLIEPGTAAYESYHSAATELRGARRAKSKWSKLGAFDETAIMEAGAKRLGKTYGVGEKYDVDPTRMSLYDKRKLEEAQAKPVSKTPISSDEMQYMTEYLRDQGVLDRRGEMPSWIEDELQHQRKWKMEFEQPGIRGTQDWRGARGGIANLTRTVAPDSGPVSRGLRSLYIDDMD